MVVTRKVKVPKRDFGDEPAPPAAPEAAEAVVEKVVPDVDESNDENVGDLSNLDEVPADDTIEESIENIKTEVEGEDGSGKRVSKPSFKVKYAGQKLSGNLSLLTRIFVSLTKKSRFKTQFFKDKLKIY